MADKMRWRYGDTNPIICAVNVDQEISIGDCLYLVTDDVRRVSQMTSLGTLQKNQAAIAPLFIGVAMQRHRATTDPAGTIRVATTGVFEFDCASATHEIGDKIACSSETAAGVLNDQKVIKTLYAGLAIGRVAQREASAKTTVLVAIQSTVMNGGVQGSSASGMS
jgi:hypothetical protein